MKKIAVIVQSKRGTTQQYAGWIAEALDASLFEAASVKPAQLADYDVVVYGGWLFASKISGVKLVTGNMDKIKSLVVFSVGLADPETTDWAETLKVNFMPEHLAEIKVFHLRGGLDFKKLGLVEKGMMSMVKKAAAKKPREKHTSEDIALLAIPPGGECNFMDKATIEPLVAYVRGLTGG